MSDLTDYLHSVGNGYADVSDDVRLACREAALKITRLSTTIAEMEKDGAYWKARAATVEAALAAAEPGKVRTVAMSDRLAEELKTWAEDERAAWPTDTAFQDDLADLLAHLAALEGA